MSAESADSTRGRDDRRRADRTREFRVEDGEHEKFAHYVPKEKLTEAMVMGTPVVALCGKAWIPSRDPERFPVCPECKEIWEGLRPGKPNKGKGRAARRRR